MSDAQLPALIEQMLQPEFYPHPVTTPIHLIQTHISYVLLTGDFAYKLKKPVNFGFLDYSTLEKRHHFCQEELRLNQRGAADLYVQVLTVTQTGDRYQFGGDGEPADYVIQMRQFPESCLFSDLLAQGDLTEDLLIQLAGVLVAYHQQGAIDDHIRSYGEATQIRQAFDENYEQSQRYVGVAQTQTQLDETKAYTDRFFADHADWFADRVAHNWVRECHGDSHLGNVALWNGTIYLFDCIEFNEPFRFVDTMFDLAFLVRDLDAAGRSDLSNVVLNAYIEQMGDWEGLQVLPLYLSRQAYVRAKITSFLLDDPAIPAADKQTAAETAALHYRLAWDYTRSPLGQASAAHQGKLILMAGMSGSGKSTVARKLAQKMGGIYIRSDAVRKHLAGLPLQEKADSSLYSAEMTEKTYARLQELGLMLARLGYPVILDARYDRQSIREAVLQAALAQGLSPQIVYCTAPIEVLQQRLQQRQGDISDATADLLAHQQQEPFSELETACLKIFDTTQDLEAQLQSSEL